MLQDAGPQEGREGSREAFKGGESQLRPRENDEVAQARIRVLTKHMLQSQTTNLRIESFTLGAMRTLLLVVALVNVGCIALGVIVSTFSFFIASSQIDDVNVKGMEYSARVSVLLIEAVTRTLACALIVFTLFYFCIMAAKFYYRKRRESADTEIPQAIMNHAQDFVSRAAYELVYGLGVGREIEDKAQKALQSSRTYMHASEQLLIFLLVLIIAMNPVLSIYGTIRMWERIAAASEDEVSAQFVVVTLSQARIGTQFFRASVVLTSLFLAGMCLFLYGMIHFQDKVLMRNSHLLLDETFIDKRPPLRPAALIRMKGSSKLELEPTDRDTRWRTKIRHFLEWQEITWKNRVSFFRHRYLKDLEFSFAIPLVLYLGCLIGFSLSLEFHPSFVPFVSIFTLIRVCMANSSAVDTTMNMTVIQSQTDNATVVVAFRSRTDPRYGVCSPSQPDPTPFNIMLVVCGLTLLEIYFFALIFRKSRQMRNALGTFPYDLTRSNQLGFAYYRILTSIMLLFMLVCSAVVVWIEPLTSYVISNVDSTNMPVGNIDPLVRRSVNPTSNGTVRFAVFDITPFAQVGLGPLVYGLGAVYLIMAVYVLELALGFIPKEVLRNQNAMTLTAESDVMFLNEILKKSAKPTKPPLKKLGSALFSPRGQNVSKFSSAAESPLTSPGHLDRQTSDFIIPDANGLQWASAEPSHPRPYRASGADTSAASRPLVVRSNSAPVLPRAGPKRDSDAEGPQTVLEIQLQSRVFVLETAVLMYHFMSLSYDLTEVEDRNAWHQTVENPAYRLVEYVGDDGTDTHAFVFESDDRVIVSFRGSVTIKNYKTDWDSSEVESEHGKAVEPLLDDEVNLAYSRRLASKKALVHGGFVKAYDSVKARIFELVEGLFNEDAQTGRRRCLFVTGHSLGGGLAVVCAFDLGVRLKLPQYRIALITWGCPKVGTFSFVKRVNRIVPCAHRIATANDIITQLPFEDPVTEWTLRGWHHVGAEILLLANGNLVIRPSPIELYIIHKLRSSVSAHFRLSYALALAAWAIRVSPDWNADWWVSVINSFHLYADFSPLPPKIRHALQYNLRRPGVNYYVKDVLVRDQAIDTAAFFTSVSVVGLEGDSSNQTAERLQLIKDLMEARDDEQEFVACLKRYMDVVKNQEAERLKKKLEEEVDLGTGSEENDDLDSYESAHDISELEEQRELENSDATSGKVDEGEA